MLYVLYSIHAENGNEILMIRDSRFKVQDSRFKCSGFNGFRWRLRRKKGSQPPPRCARQPLPREGARVDAPSFLWKEVPRRGGGWMGIAV